MTGHTVHTINIIRCAVGNCVYRTERLCRESELCEEGHLLRRKHKCSAGNTCVVAKDLGLNKNKIVIMK
jgi:hypothetical protein